MIESVINDLQIFNLKKRPEFAEAVASWIQTEWGILPIHSFFNSIAAKKKWFLNLPVTLVAVLNNEPIGTVSFLLDDLETRLEFNPWIGCLYVRPNFRRQGIANKLMKVIEDISIIEHRFTEIYLFTENLEKFNLRLGWKNLEDDVYNGKPIKIMKKTVDPRVIQSNAEEIDLLTDFFNKAPISMWACDSNYNIVLWNSGAEDIYGYTKDEALGSNYLELFVDEFEEEQSKIDCDRVIKSGWMQQNCLAYDKNKYGEQRYMLTNVFRIRPSFSVEAYQAEIGVVINDLGLRKDEHRKLRELGIKRLAIHSVDAKKEILISKLKSVKIPLTLNKSYKLRDLSTWFSQHNGVSEKQFENFQKDIEQDFIKDDKILEDLIKQISKCTSMEDLQVVEKKIQNKLVKLDN